jgi:hypothetical protein
MGGDGWNVANWERAAMVVPLLVGKPVLPLHQVAATAAPPAAHIATPRNRLNRRGKNTVAGTEINERANIIVANRRNPANTASVMVRTFHVNPAVAPLSNAITPRPPMGMKSRMKTITEMMARTTLAPMGKDDFHSYVAGIAAFLGLQP